MINRNLPIPSAVTKNGVNKKQTAKTNTLDFFIVSLNVKIVIFEVWGENQN